MEILNNIYLQLLEAPIGQLVGYVYMLCVLIFMLILGIKNKNLLKRAMLGEDGQMSIPEFVIFIWFVLFPQVVLADVFLGLKAGEAVWWSLDAIMLFALTGKVVLGFRQGSNNTTDWTEKASTTMKTEKPKSDQDEEPVL